MGLLSYDNSRSYWAFLLLGNLVQNNQFTGKKTQPTKQFLMHVSPLSFPSQFLKDLNLLKESDNLFGSVFSTSRMPLFNILPTSLFWFWFLQLVHFFSVLLFTPPLSNFGFVFETLLCTLVLILLVGSLPPSPKLFTHSRLA